MRTADGQLAHIDQHSLAIAADRDAVWSALRDHVSSLLHRLAASPLSLLLGTRPRGGFEVVEEVLAERLVLEGQHRFSVYRLTFVLHAEGATTRLTASSDAEFPGLGRLYRALVIGTGLHVVAVRRLLADVRARASATSGGSDPASGGARS